jgi:hypothetical protein
MVYGLFRRPEEGAGQGSRDAAGSHRDQKKPTIPEDQQERPSLPAFLAVSKCSLNLRVTGTRSDLLKRFDHLLANLCTSMQQRHGKVSKTAAIPENKTTAHRSELCSRPRINFPQAALRRR